MHQYLPAVLLLFVLYSCDSPRYIYSPAPPNNPYFKEKGESKLAAYYSGGSSRDRVSGAKNRGFDLQAAYAVGNHLAVTATHFNRRERDIYPDEYYNFFDSSDINYKRSITDIGLGYFVPVNEPGTLSFNIFGGIGLGKFSFTDRGIDNTGQLYGRFHRTSVTKGFVQPAFNLMANEYFRAAIIGRLSFVHYNNAVTNYSDEESRYFSLDRINNRTFTFFEPTLYFQVGFAQTPWLKIDGGITLSSDPASRVSGLETRNFNASVGLCFDFSKLKD